MTRLNRYLSSCGLGSRRGCEELILNGKVRVNGQLVTSLATKVNPSDEVSVRGRKLEPQKILIVALHKPKGYVCTRSDERARQTIYDLLPREYQTLHHIGRLDMDSSGLILLTNDGALSHRLTHPSKGIEKEYEVTVEEQMDETVSPKLVKGMLTPEGFAKAERAWLYGGFKIGIVLKQGLKRQIRHMLYQLGHEVRKLERVRIGGYFLKGMAIGSWRELTGREVDKLLAGANKTGDSEEKPARSKSDSQKVTMYDLKPEPKSSETKDKPRRAFRPRRSEVRDAPADVAYESKPPRPRSGDSDERPRRAFKQRGPEARDTKSSTSEPAQRNTRNKPRASGTRRGGQRNAIVKGKKAGPKRGPKKENRSARS